MKGGYGRLNYREIEQHLPAYEVTLSVFYALRGVTLRVAPGEFVALSGTSGCGKSTLIKSVAGLYKPSYSNVYIDGQPLSRWNAQLLRSQIALVAQGDIERMPMGYESLVGDMGSTLSGGQKQRVLLARALYRRPRILILREGCSHRLE